MVGLEKKSMRGIVEVDKSVKRIDMSSWWGIWHLMALVTLDRLSWH